jgi:hypothetical protein
MTNCFFDDYFGRYASLTMRRICAAKRVFVHEGWPGLHIIPAPLATRVDRGVPKKGKNIPKTWSRFERTPRTADCYLTDGFEVVRSASSR